MTIPQPDASRNEKSRGTEQTVWTHLNSLLKIPNSWKSSVVKQNESVQSKITVLRPLTCLQYRLRWPRCRVAMDTRPQPSQLPGADSKRRWAPRWSNTLLPSCSRRSKGCHCYRSPTSVRRETRTVHRSRGWVIMYT